MERELQLGQVYRHFKGKLYRTLTVATHTETGEQLVIYQALYGKRKTFARPYENFMSEVDLRKHPYAEQRYRFELVPPGTIDADPPF